MPDEHDFPNIRSDFLSLLANPGWQRLKRVADEQIHDRRESLELAGGGNELGPIKYLLGEIGALRLFLSIPQQQIDECEAIMDAMPDEEENTDGN